MNRNLFLLPAFMIIFFLSTGFTSDLANKTSPYRVEIYKHKYEMVVYREDGWWAKYPVVFGNESLNKKTKEGDRCTPEGSYKITYKKPHQEWGYFMLLNYPNEKDLAEFKEKQKKGMIPANANPGNGIGIHGTRRNQDNYVDDYINWTLGCISTKRDYIKEIYELLPVGTEVVIFP
jgi:murein L,D-transpeptidase YafK